MRKQINLKPPISIKKVNFTYKPIKYNQYVQTHMSWHDEKYLTKQQPFQVPIRISTSKSKQMQSQQKLKHIKNPTAMKMPIPQFHIDHMSESESQEEQSLKISIGVAKQNSFLISSQMTTFPLKYEIASIQTQTDDFTFLDDLFSEAKIYQIPVQVEVQDMPSLYQRSIQVNQSFFGQFLQKLQQNISAVRRQSNLFMNSGTVSLSVQNFSFQKLQRGEQNQGSSIHKKQNPLEKPIFEQQEEMLLEISPLNESKQNLYKTGHFQLNFGNNQFYNTPTPQKSRISGSQSSPDTDGPMRMTQRQVNMMQTNDMDNLRIDEEQYEDLQSRFYMIQQQNLQKTQQLQTVTNKLIQLQKQIQQLRLSHLNIIQQLSSKNQNLSKQLTQKQNIITQIQENLAYYQQKIQSLQNIIKQKDQQIEQILIKKQKQMNELGKEIEGYREEMQNGEQKLQKLNQALIKQLADKQIQITELRQQFDSREELYLITMKELKQKITAHQNSIEKLQLTIAAKQLKITELKEESQKQKDQLSVLFKMRNNFSNTNSKQTSIQQHPLEALSQRNQGHSQVSNKNFNSKRHYSTIVMNNNHQYNKSHDFQSSSTIQPLQMPLRQHSNNLFQGNGSKESQKLQQKKKLIPNNKSIPEGKSYQSYIKQQKNNNLNDPDPQMEQNLLDSFKDFDVKKKMKVNFKISQNQPQPVNQGAKKSSSLQSNKQYQNSESKGKYQYNDTVEQESSNVKSSAIDMETQQGQIFIQQQTSISPVQSSILPKQPFVNYSFQKQRSIMLHKFNSPLYHEELQKFALIYQSIIQKQIETIQQLQQKVLQFLKDALTKQTEAQLLYNQLCQYENNMNGLLIQKMDIDLQNKRLKKMITDSQNKLAVLGARLIKLAKNNSVNVFNMSKSQIKDPNSSNSLEQQINR